MTTPHAFRGLRFRPPDGHAPRSGELFRNPELVASAEVVRDIVPAPDELRGQLVDDPLDAAIRGRRNTLQRRRYLGDPKSAAAWSGRAQIGAVLVGHAGPPRGEA